MLQESPIYIAYVDEQNIVRKAISDYISQLDGRFNVFIEASGGADLLDQISHSSHQPDVCIFDILIPDINGYDMLLELRKKYPYIKSIILTRLDNEFVMWRVIKHGAMGYVSKNAPSCEIKQAIIDVYSDYRYVSPNLLKKFPGILGTILNSSTNKLFSEREVQILSMCCSDLSYIEIGNEINLSHRTVENYCIKLREKLKINSRIGLGIFALNCGIANFNIDKKTSNNHKKH